MIELSLSAKSAADLDVDALVIGLVGLPTTGPAGAAAGRPAPRAELAPGHGLPRSTVSHLSAAISSLRLTGAADEVTTLPAVPRVRAPLVVLTGLGGGSTPGRGHPADPADPEAVRRGIGAAVRSLAGRARVAVVVPKGRGGDAGVILAAAAEGAGLGAYAVTTRRTDGEAPEAVSSVTLVGAGEGTGAGGVQARAALRRAAVLADATAYARDLVNEPPNVLYPQTFVDSVRARARGTKVSVTVLDERELAAGSFGGLVGVGMGSVHPPRLAVLRYSPRGAKVSLALVGKGITFDSGGVNLKAGASMGTMKSDMAGAAAVAATVLAVAALGLPVRVTGYCALAENMPSGTAQRPSDIVTMRNGTTVEIIDTDAEGRMVLGDAIAYASESAPDAVIDIATLTGAQVIALGPLVAAVMGNEEPMRTRVVEAAGRAGEAAWPMPLPEELRPSLSSPVADLVHKAGAPAGMLVSGLFLREFVGARADGSPIPWAHLDIAGPSFNSAAPHGYTPTGGTGYGVRTLVATAEQYADPAGS